MSTLIFTCPKTGRRFESGVDMERDTLVKVRGIVVRVHCAHCHEVHEQSIKDGHLSAAA
jgi:hypothetical protein